MSSNSKGGNYYTTAELTMAAYDKLPPAARRALANAMGNWAPQPYLTRYKRGVIKTGQAIASWVQYADRELLKKYERQRRLAIGPYKGNVPEKSCQAT